MIWIISSMGWLNFYINFFLSISFFNIELIKN